MSLLLQAISAVNTAQEARMLRSGVCYATVRATKPLKVELEQNLMLSAPFLAVAKHLTDYEVEFDIQGEDIQAQGNCPDGAVFLQDEWTGYGVITLKNALKIGDVVALLRLEGGEQYLIVDRVEKDG